MQKEGKLRKSEVKKSGFGGSSSRFSTAPKAPSVKKQTSEELDAEEAKKEAAAVASKRPSAANKKAFIGGGTVKA